MAIAVKDAGESRALEIVFDCIHIRRNDGFVEDLPAGEVGVQVDVGSQEEVLGVIFGTIAQQHQVLCRSDPVRVVRLSRPAAVFGVGWEA
jgi:hypothetical protein